MVHDCFPMTGQNAISFTWFVENDSVNFTTFTSIPIL